MTNQMPYVVAPYEALAPIYDEAGFSTESRENVARYISAAQSVDWAGRRILDIGCGTGATTWWLAQQGFRVAGIDHNVHMLTQAQHSPFATGEFVHDPPQFAQMDIRAMDSPLGAVDMVIGLGGVINALPSLRELERAFTQVNQALDPERMFVFDMRTIHGLAASTGDGDVVYYDNQDDLAIIIRSSFSYETLSNTRHYLVWRKQNGAWSRQDEIHVERGFPTQGVIAMLERTGFEVTAVLNARMQPFDFQQDRTGHAVFMAVKRGN